VLSDESQNVSKSPKSPKKKETIKIVIYLLAKLIRQPEQDFPKHGGLRERMTKARIESRNSNKSSL
jgi:four helix bundle suffix protein